MSKKPIVTILLTVIALNVGGQCRYCNSYEDFLADRWEELDTVYVNNHSKSRQMWLGGNDYTLTTGDKDMDKLLKKYAFVVMQADTLYVNCRKLRFEGTRFGNGYTKARRIGEQSLLLVNKIKGERKREEATIYPFMFGTIGGYVVVSKQFKQQVCYIISSGADEKGQIAIRLIDDYLMNQMIMGRRDLYEEYHAEEKESKRILATHVIPILEKAGLFEQSKHEETSP